MKKPNSILWLSLILLIGLSSCGRNHNTMDKKSVSAPAASSDCSGIICTEQYEQIMLKLLHQDGTPVVLDDYKVVQVSDKRDITIKNEFSFLQARETGDYIIISDLYKNDFRDKQVEIEFTGYTGNKIAVQERFLVGADCCHVLCHSGNLNVIL